MKHSMKKVLCLVIALLMAISVFPMAVFATGGTSNLLPSEEKILLSMDDLLGTNINGSQKDKAKINTPDTSGQVTAKALADGGIAFAANQSSHQYASYIVDTGLPLNASSTYTIQFTAKAGSGASHMGFALTTITGTNTVITEGSRNHWLSGQIIHIQDGTNLFAGRGNVWSNTVNATEVPDISSKCIASKIGDNIPLSNTGVTWTDDTLYTLVLNGTVVSVYANNLYMGSFDFAEDIQTKGYQNDTLAIGFKGRAKADADVAIWTMRNIKVYDGTVVSPETEGTKLLSLSSLNANAVTDGDNIKVTQVTAKNSEANATDATAIDSTVANTGRFWSNYGVMTSLPLNTTSKYTIEYEAKVSKYDNSCPGLCFTDKQGFIFWHDKTVTTVHDELMDPYLNTDNTNSSTFNNIWTAYADKDGYTRFHVEIDGIVVTLFIGGRKAATYSLDSINTGKNATEGLSSANLYLTFKLRNDGGAEDGETLANVKNISVYAGNVMSKRKVTFEKPDGALIDTKYYSSDEVVGTFPNVTPATDGNKIVWKVKGTNVIAKEAHIVTGSVTLVAYEVGKYTTELVAAQQYVGDDLSEANIARIRFVGGLYELDGDEVGFEIVANYSGGTKSWTRQSSSVYSSIVVTNKDKSTETVTAEDMGAAYLFALDIGNVPTNEGEITFTVTPFKMVGEQRVNGTASTVRLADGILTE